MFWGRGGGYIDVIKGGLQFTLETFTATLARKCLFTPPE